MKKYLATFAFVILLASNGCCKSANPASNAGDSQQPSQTAANVAPQNGHSPTFKDDSGKKDDEQISQPIRITRFPPRDTWDYIAIGATLLLAFIGIVGIAVGICTLCFIRVQAREMQRQNKNIVKQSAIIERQIRVAEADTQAMIRAERAWIVASVDEFPVGVYRFWVENKGKTPARTDSFWGESLYVEVADPYIEKPDATTRGALLSFPPCLMPPGDKRLVWECHRSAIEEASGGGKGEQSRFARGFGTGFIYGRIRYFDVLDVQPQEPHETRWLYWLIPQPGSVPFPHPTQPEQNTYS